MNKKMMILVISLTIILNTFIGCSFDKKNEQQDRNIKPKGNVDELEKEEEVDPIFEEIGKMSLDEKIGQMFIIGLEGHTMDDSAIEMLEKYKVGGFILLGENIDNSMQLLHIINELKSTNKKNKIPLFISVDEEGGKISRMPDELKKIPTNRIIGQKNDKEFSYNIGSIIAEEIKSFGFNINFAPVLDIDSNPNNPVIGDRSYGSNEKIVSDLGIQTMKGIQSKGVISIVKHFPGHGDTSVDSHVGLPKVDKDVNSLMEFELIPFKDSIENNVDGIMIAHILFNNIDPHNPATLSSKIIEELLRGKLNYEGLVLTDDMTMGAIMENYDIGDAVVKSIDAGSDIVLVCHGYENMIQALESLKDAVENGIIQENRIDESLYRILKIKEKYELQDVIIEEVDIDKINNNMSRILNYYEDK
jgi:beta-N-acetylhexosaminidase